jgi:hypothetical protein
MSDNDSLTVGKGLFGAIDRRAFLLVLGAFTIVTDAFIIT